ncbi:SET domain-containing protein [Trichoderma simmonsii]|uniref:SET domain-containing protein n=1 Tax=Trichoderma simmonsii TaxID=1491479 RepID=A0A8G0LBM4_9HYPO|nr:SET domain-containing protein [Trichoderma simmonsii]
MAYSLTVAALLHPWSGRIDIASRLPLRRNESAISNGIPFPVDRYPTTVENYKTRRKSLSVDLPWILRGQRDAAEYEVAEEEESTRLLFPSSSISDTHSDVLSSGDATCEYSDNMSETLEMEANDTCDIQEDTDNTDVDLEIPKVIKATSIPSAILKMSPEPMYGNDYFEIAKSNVAGWGAFATRDLTKGDVILREIPFFAVAHYVSGLFPIAARFNHACDPINNVEYEFDHDNGVLTMMVREDVAAGTELKISYGKNLSPQDFFSLIHSITQSSPSLAMPSCDRCEKIFTTARRRRSYVIEQTYYEEWGHGKYAICGYDFDDVQRLVDYLYTGDYKTTPSDSSEEQDKASELIAHGNLLGLAEEYGIPGLLQLSMEKGKAAIRDEPETRALIECIPKVYESVVNPDSMIFNLMIESIRERIGRTPLDLNARYILNSAMQEAPDFARGLAMSFAAQQPQNEGIVSDL